MKLKVLILIDWFLPGNKAGGPVKSIYSLIKSLGDKIDFYVITMNTDILSEKAYDVCINQWTIYDGINVYYFSKDNFSWKKLREVIRSLSPNVIYINSFWSYKFSILPLILKKLKLIRQPIILAPRGMLEEGAMSIKSLKKNIFLLVSNVLGLHRNIIIHATSDSEMMAVKKQLGKTVLFKISNLSYVDGVFSKIDKQRENLKLIYLSRVSPVKNLDFAIKVLSKINSIKNSTIEYDIYGNNEDKEYFKYCRELMKQLPPSIKVTYRGTLNFEDIPKVISQYHFLFLPTKNENFGHAIVETLSCGRPVLISNCTPWNEVNEWQCGYALPLDENKFVEKIKEMLEMNNPTFQKMCGNARDFIKEKMDVEKIKTEYLKMFEYAARSENN
ncbi:MAG: hypothetical protein Fur0023_14240 [Bacteroidia bacterium]